MKKNIKKWMTSIAATAMITSAVPAIASAQEPVFKASCTFTDVSSRYHESVEFLYSYDMISGKSLSEFGTYDNLKRGDAAIILANALGLDTETASDAGFTDLNDRYKGAVNALAAENIVSGYTATTFEPYKELSRGEMAKLLTLSFGLESYAKETPFTDDHGVFESYIQALYGAGITTGKSATSYGTTDKITRGDFANLLYDSLDYSYSNIPTAAEASFVDSNTVFVKLEQPAPSTMTDDEAASYLYIEYTVDGLEYPRLVVLNPVLSADRQTVTFDIKDLVGKTGTLYVDSVELAFSF